MSQKQKQAHNPPAITTAPFKRKGGETADCLDRFKWDKFKYKRAIRHTRVQK